MLATCCNHTGIIQMVKQSALTEKWPSCNVFKLLNNADFDFCYVIKMLILPRRARAQLSPTINISPATSYFGENPGYCLAVRLQLT